jgi:hypothetical protein
MRETPGVTTPFENIKTVWLAATPTARKERLNGGFFFHPNGHILEVFQRDLPPQRVDLQLWGTVAKQTMAKIRPALEKMLPTGFTFPAIPVESVRDDFSVTSVFEQEHNRAIFDPTFTRLLGALLSPGEANHGLVSASGELRPDAAKSWLALEQIVLALIVSGFSMTCGNPPRDWQYGRLRFAPTARLIRNFFIVNGTPIFANPEAKQMDQQFLPNLWAFPPAMVMDIFLYLAFVRPVALRIMEKLHMDVSFHQSYVWSHSIYQHRREHQQQWSGTDVNAAITKNVAGPLNVKANMGRLRQMVTAVYKFFVPQLFDAAFRTGGVSKQGQHTPYTERIHYGFVLNIPACLEMDLSEANRLFAISRIWQALFDMAPVDEAWEGLIGENHILPSNRHLGASLERARTAINIYYGVGGSDEDGIRKRVEDVLVKKPFIYSPEVRSIDLFSILCVLFLVGVGKDLQASAPKWTILGDPVLSCVTRAVLFGSCDSGAGTTPPVCGFTVDDVACAVSKVRNSMFNGCY